MDSDYFQVIRYIRRAQLSIETSLKLLEDRLNDSPDKYGIREGYKQMLYGQLEHAAQLLIYAKSEVGDVRNNIRNTSDG